MAGCRASRKCSLRATGSYFELFEEAGQNVCSRPTCSSGCSPTTPTARSWRGEILDCEHEGDRITHDIINRLNHTFVTPIDREDILALASALDDIVDYTEEVADYLGLYRIEAPMDQAISWRRCSSAACRQIGRGDPAAAGLP